MEKGFVGSKVKEEGAYIWYNALKWYLDPERRYPIELNLNAMFQFLNYEVNGDKLTLPQIIQTLKEGEKFSWVIYGEFKHPIGDMMLEMEVIPHDDIANFIDVKLPKITEKKPLKTPSNFKILFTFTKNEAWTQFLRKERPLVSFGMKGKGRRSGFS
jgi:hypothetical protein